MPKRRKRKNRTKQTVRLQTAPRNPYVHHPLMKRGGAHETSQSAQRAIARRETRRLARDWVKLKCSALLLKTIWLF